VCCPEPLEQRVRGALAGWDGLCPLLLPCSWPGGFGTAALPWLLHPFCRIRESLRLEKTSKIIKSNHQPNPTMPAKPSPQVPHPHGFWTPPGMRTPPLLWAAWSNAWPLCQWRHFSWYPIWTSPDATDAVYSLFGLG